MTDGQWLQDFRDTHSNAAFAKLVEAHIDLAHSVARRSVHDEALAQDITQAVFLILAKKAPMLPKTLNLAGWIFRTTQYVAANALRAHLTRRQHERQYAISGTPTSYANDESTSEALAAVDCALGRLNKTDQEAVLLKYYLDHTWEQVGNALGISEEAARKRVHRSLARLRELLPEGMAVVALPDLLAGKAVSAAPAHLASHALAGATAAASSPASTASTLANGTLQMLFRAHLAKGVIAAAAAVAIATGGIAAFSTSFHLKTNAAAPAVIPPGAQASQATPIEAYRNLDDALKAGDEAAIVDLVQGDTPRERQVVSLQAHLAYQVAQLRSTIARKLGPDAANNTINMIHILRVPQNSTETITDHSASIDFGPLVSLPMVEVNGQWKAAFKVMTTSLPPVPHELYVRWQEAQWKLIDGLIAETNAGKYADIKALNLAYMERMFDTSEKLAADFEKAASNAPPANLALPPDAAAHPPIASPIEAARTLTEAIAAGDEEAMVALVHTETAQQRQIVIMESQFAHDAVRLRQTVTETFGSGSLRDFVDIVSNLRIPLDATATITGDKALIYIGETFPLPIVRVDGGWKMPFMVVATLLPPVPYSLWVRWSDERHRLMVSLTEEIHSGRLADLKAVNSALLWRMADLSQKLALDYEREHPPAAAPATRDSSK